MSPAMSPDKYTLFEEFQLNLLEELKQGKDYKVVAELARRVIKSIYKNPPIGAELGLSVNDVCNLHCKHCYYYDTHITGFVEDKDSLSLDEWKSVIHQALDMGITHFPIIGKEPLLSPEICREILSVLQDEKKRKDLIRYEIITNGTLIEKEIDWLKELEFYFFSISIDGDKEEHDKLRGEGNYAKSLEGLRHAKRSGMKNLSITYTANPSNVVSLEKTIYELEEAGAEYLSIVFCFPTAYNHKELSADIFTLETVLTKVEKVDTSLNVGINLVGENHPSLIANLYSKNIIREERCVITEDLAPALVIPLCEAPSKAILINLLPTMYFGGFRIDYNGNAIDYCSDLRQPETKRGFGNVRKVGLSKLWEKAQLELWPQYTMEYYQRLQQALRAYL